MANYRFGVTDKGRQLIAKLLTGEVLEITRVMFGSGKPSSGSDIAGLTGLIESVAQGTSSNPRCDGGVATMVVEYRSDLNGGLKNGFWLTELGVFANDPDEGEVMIYYASLGEYPQWVNPLGVDGGVDVRRFPIAIAIGDDKGISVDYKTDVWVTESEVIKLIEEYMGNADELAKEILSVSHDSLEISIPATGWTDMGSGKYRYARYISLSGGFSAVGNAGYDYFPIITIYKEYMEAAKDAVFCPVCELDGSTLKLWAGKIPASEIRAGVQLEIVARSNG